MAIYLVAGKLLERALQSACRSSATNLKIIMSMSIPNEGVAANPLLVAHHVDPRQDGGKKKKFAGGAVKYMECLKNHAAGIGGSATDGCGEFLAGGEEGSLEALKCCACNCHRNFHRKIHVQQPLVDPAGVLRMKGAYDYDLEERRRKAAVDEGEGEVGMRKRFRSKFSQEQKEKMQRFAEKSGWKLQKAGDAEVRSFCEEIGVKRKVLKVWMHNNKYHFANNPNPNSPFAN